MGDKNTRTKTRWHALLRPGLLSVMLAASVLLESACNRDRESAKDLLRERQREWGADLRSIHRDHDHLQRELASLPPPAATETAIPLGRLGIQAGLASVRQVMADVTNYAAQTDTRLHAALANDGDTAFQALEEEDKRMNGYFVSLHEDLVRLGKEVAGLRPKTSSPPTP